MISITHDQAQRIIRFCEYLDKAINLEPAGPCRNRDFHMLTETTEITKELKAKLEGH